MILKVRLVTNVVLNWNRIKKCAKWSKSRKPLRVAQAVSTICVVHHTFYVSLYFSLFFRFNFFFYSNPMQRSKRISLSILENIVLWKWIEATKAFNISNGTSRAICNLKPELNSEPIQNQAEMATPRFNIISSNILLLVNVKINQMFCVESIPIWISNV